MPDLTRTLTPVEVTKSYLLSKCEYFTDVQLWPITNELNATLWLSNFSDDEMGHAVQLLNSFMYFSERLCNAMFKAAFQTLSQRLRRPEDSFMAAQTAWQNFMNNVIISYITGENPSVTDSGYLFTRKARQLLGIAEEQILSPENTLSELLGRVPRPVVFVDDFVGSGNQFITTWHRSIKLLQGISFSFERISHIRGTMFYYCPLICTQYGLEAIQKRCPRVVVNPAHILPTRYNALDVDSLIWPAHLQPTAENFLREASKRAGIPDTDGGEDDWRGFHKLGLTLAFFHSVPDATLPLFYWEGNGWKPLLRRT